MAGKQVEYAIKFLLRYRQERGERPVRVRGLHYFIVSLPESERRIPAKRNGEFRIYQNTLADYQNLSRLLVKVRTEELIPWDWIVDEKNELPQWMPERQHPDYFLTPDIGDLHQFFLPALSDTLPQWNDFKISVQSEVLTPNFSGHSHRVVLAIEKSTAYDDLKQLCQQYGADFLCFSGQFSVTRVNDIVEAARSEDLPVALLYISDLDCAGWLMPTAFFKRLNEIYPHEDHKFVRVGLTRDQANHLNLPTSFEPDNKGYKPGQIARFIEESGGHACIELDAVDDRILIKWARKELEKWQDQRIEVEQYEETCSDAGAAKEGAIERIDLSNLSTKYEEIYKEHNQIINELKPYFERSERLQRLKEDFYSVLYNRITNAIEGARV